MTKPGKPLVLVADDDPDVLRMLQHVLQQWGYQATVAPDKGTLMEEVFQRPPSVVLLDLFFGEHDGLEILADLLRQHPSMTIVLLTAYGSIDTAVQAMRVGAFDYLTKPVDISRLQAVVARAVDERELATAKPPSGDAQDRHHRPIVGVSPAMQQLRDLISNVAPTDASVLILGESGTGKELVARALHQQSPRSKGPFIPLNMAALPRELVESTLFGHEQGAFTGAHQAQKGCCEMADGGTLFLDEIGEMEIGLQSKLLRFLQEQTVQRVGSTRQKRVDVRIVSATNRDPLTLVRQGQLREDLYYRLNVIPLFLSPLRERPEDVPVLSQRFLQRAADRLGKNITGFTEGAMRRLQSCSWPGNVRQLENLVERLAIFCRGTEITEDLIPTEVDGRPAFAAAGDLAGRPPAPPVADAPAAADADDKLRAMDQIERKAILEALDKANGHVGDAARLLGLGQATIYRKLKRYGISTERRRRGGDET